MRHRNNVPKLSLKAAPRRALLRNLATSLVLKNKIQTTLPKAKALRPIVEKLVTASRKNNLTARRKLIAYLFDEKAVNKMLTEIGVKYATRPGGYTRIMKLGKRRGDDAEMAIIEFVD
ncbi:MAG: 50S ribosomal protein L17 [Parcubacteria group bacterium]